MPKEKLPEVTNEKCTSLAENALQTLCNTTSVEDAIAALEVLCQSTQSEEISNVTALADNSINQSHRFFAQPKPLSEKELIYRKIMDIFEPFRSAASKGVPIEAVQPVLDFINDRDTKSLLKKSDTMNAWWQTDGKKIWSNLRDGTVKINEYFPAIEKLLKQLIDECNQKTNAPTLAQL